MQLEMFHFKLYQSIIVNVADFNCDIILNLKILLPTFELLVCESNNCVTNLFYGFDFIAEVVGQLTYIVFANV